MKDLLLIFLLCCGTLASGQSSYWEELNAPPGGAPSSLVQIANGWVYAEFYDHSMYCSKDLGRHWEQIFQPSGDLNTGFQQITVGQAGTLFAERKLGSGIVFNNPYHFDTYKSIDNGASWQVFTDSATIHGIGETSTGTLFAIKEITTYQSQLIRSEDGGITWDSLTEAYQTTNFKVTVDMFDHLLVADKLLGGTVLISIDHGQTWVGRYIQLPDNVVLTPTGTLLYIDFNDIHRQAYNSPGAEIIPADSIVLPGDYPAIFSLLVMQNGDVFANTSTHLYKSTDDGHTWDPLPNDIRSYQLIGPYSLQDGSIFISRTGTDMSKSPDYGQSFTFSGLGINRGGINTLYTQSDSCWLAMTDPGLFKTTDEGQHWQLLQEGLHKNPFAYNENALAWDSSGIYVLSNDSLFYSTNLGASFQLLQLPDSLHPRLVALGTHAASHAIFVNKSNGTARSTDMGQTWQTVADSLYCTEILEHPSGALFGILSRETWTQNTSFYGQFTYISALYRSQDGGQTWEPVISEPVSSFTINPLGEIFAAVDHHKLLKSIDGGNSWNEVTYKGEKILSNDANQLVVHDSYKYLFLSNDFGNSWYSIPQPINQPMTTFGYQTISSDHSNRLYASVWEYVSEYHLYRSTKPTTSGAYLTGTVYKDADGDCSTLDVETPLANWIVKAEGADTWWASTDTAGRYTMFLDTGAYFLSVKPAIHLLWEPCGDSLPVQLSVLQDTTLQDLPVKAIADCPYMTVDIAAPWLEKCFEGQVYVRYCNEGTLPADSAWVDVTLDPYLTFSDTLNPLPHAWVDSATIRFYLGEVVAGHCDQFSFSVYVDCDSTILGQTLCVAAHIYPDSVCIALPNWSGAEIQVVARCEQDTALTFSVTNIGTGESQPLQYFVIEDDVVTLQGTEIYNAGQPRDFSMPANGHFRRFESEQEPGHPFSMKVAAWTEGCGGFNSLGFPTWYFLNNGIPSEAVYCGEIVGAFDPNDKQGLPVGFGDEHLVAPNTDIDYMIRFQNTGTASAHTVIIRDTLSAMLDPGTIRFGASSHPFSWKLSGNGFLTIQFDNIDLPDSNSNELNSHGFIRFKISQQPDLADGSAINNTASIYFDFNGAVRTNKTTHRVGRNFIEFVGSTEPESHPIGLRISPNPVSSSAILTMEGLTAGDYQFILTDISGKISCVVPFTGNKLALQRQQLMPGMFFFQVIDDHGVMKGSGKLLIR